MFSLLATLLSSCKREAYESQPYVVVKSDGAFELRDYPESTLVSTPMQRRGGDGSFMRLFRFIQGGNENSEKISMTVPVLMSGTTSGTMSFVVPRNVALKGVPKPSDKAVTLTTMPAAHYAAYRFSGMGNPVQSELAAQKLRGWMDARKLTAEGEPLFAYYNPPWTPWFMRRNEVLIRISSPNP